MNLQTLKTEIETGPLAAECVGKSDDEVASILNDPRFQMVKVRFITARTMLAELITGATILDKLDAASAVSSPVKWAMVYLLGESGIDVGHPGTIAQLDMLVAAGMLTADEAAAVKGMAMQPASRAEILGWPPVTYNDVNAARAL